MVNGDRVADALLPEAGGMPVPLWTASATVLFLVAMNVKSPTCKRVGDWFAGSSGPFCSRRCKLVDLGKWFSEEHAISAPLRPEDLEKFAELPPGEHLDQGE